MAKLVWDKIGERIFEMGDRNVALYVYNSEEQSVEIGSKTYKSHYGPGVAWNGITAMTESPSGAEATDLWADDIKYATMRSAEQFGGTIEAYTFPDEWMDCDGSAEIGTTGVVLGQQRRKAFGLAYITTVGNDTEQNDYGEKIHLIYGATASPSERSYATINDSPDAITFSWEYETTPVEVGTIGGTEYKSVSCITIDKRKVVYTGTNGAEDATKLALWNSFKELLFGGASTEPILPMPADVIAFFQ